MQHTKNPGSHSLHLAFGSCIYLPQPPFHFATDQSVWQVLGSFGMGAHGWKARVYQPWECNSYHLGDGFAISDFPDFPGTQLH